MHVSAEQLTHSHMLFSSGNNYYTHTHTHVHSNTHAHTLPQIILLIHMYRHKHTHPYVIPLTQMRACTHTHTHQGNSQVSPLPDPPTGVLQRHLVSSTHFTVCKRVCVCVCVCVCLSFLGIPYIQVQIQGVTGIYTGSEISCRGSNRVDLNKATLQP